VKRIDTAVTIERDDEPTWVAPTHRAFLDAGITVIGHVPDGGLSCLIERLETDERLTTVRLTTEEEGIAMCAGVWLGGGRTALLMQSSGVGNCTNMLGLLKTCEVPAVFLVTMRGQVGESNPWQVPMGEATAPTFELMGVDVISIGSAAEVAPAVAAACEATFEQGRAAHAVLIEQSVIGIKVFPGDGG